MKKARRKSKNKKEKIPTPGQVLSATASAIESPERPAFNMKLDSIEFTEYRGTPKEWVVEPTDFEDITLVVGRNASGKSRLLNIITALTKLLTGRRLYESGRFRAVLSSAEHKYEYTLDYQSHMVLEERLLRDNETLLDRSRDGTGTIWAAELQRSISFEAPRDQLAARVRRDRIQHPFFEDLFTWASLLRHYQFGTPLGRDVLMLIQEKAGVEAKETEISDPNQVTNLYVRSFSEWKEKFDRAVLRDLALLGYDCEDVGAEQADKGTIQGPPVAVLFVKEKELQTNTNQIAMSQGMFRALALVIHLNYCVFRGKPRTILIDDIGEGLDFSRAQKIVALLIERAKQHNFQLVMTTNDRFVMNGVRLEYWNVIKRQGHRVSLINKRNSARTFEQFEQLGLNNFDFFSTNFFEEGLK